MTAYWSIFSARFRVLLQYRAAALAGFGTQLFFGFVRVMIFAAFYASSDAVHPMSYEEVVTYVWLGQAMLLIVLYGVDTDVQGMVRNGTVAYELIRPLDLYGIWFVRAVAYRIGPLLLRAVPMFIVAGLFLGLQAPPSLASAALWLLSTAGALLLSSAIATLMTISLLWTVSGEGISRIGPAFIFVCSGLIVPLPLFPDWIQPLLNFLPFRGMADVPFRIYMGHIPPAAAVFAIAHQIIWTAAFVFLGRWVLGRGLRKLVVQGG